MINLPAAPALGLRRAVTRAAMPPAGPAASASAEPTNTDQYRPRSLLAVMQSSLNSINSYVKIDLLQNIDSTQT